MAKNNRTQTPPDNEQKVDSVPVVPQIGGARSAPVDPKSLLVDGDAGVLMSFPKHVNITLQDHRTVAFKPGTRRVPTFIAKVPVVKHDPLTRTSEPMIDEDTGEQKTEMHWYLRANGVTVLEPDDE